MSKMKTAPPKHLLPRSKDLWQQIVPRRVNWPERLALLQVALEALDRAEQAREAILRDGMTFTTEATGAVHIHPLVKVEREARQQFIKAWNALRLQWDRYVGDDGELFDGLDEGDTCEDG